jgi:hypothetical protein
MHGVTAHVALPAQMHALVFRTFADRKFQFAVGGGLLFHLALVAVGDTLHRARAAVDLGFHGAAGNAGIVARASAHATGGCAGTGAALLRAHDVALLVALLLHTEALGIGVVERLAVLAAGAGRARRPLFVGVVVRLVVDLAALVRVHDRLLSCVELVRICTGARPCTRAIMRAHAQIQYRKTLRVYVGRILTSYLLPEV